MAGVAIFTGVPDTGVTGSLLGDGLVMLGTVFAALYVVVSSRLVSQVPPAALAALQQSVGLVATLLLLVAWLPLKTSIDEIVRRYRCLKLWAL
jgi:drug/metabolite transporter (DMT)-like permease